MIGGGKKKIVKEQINNYIGMSTLEILNIEK